jgi:hypothetical protein
MTAWPDKFTNKVEAEESQGSVTPLPESKREIYPQVNDRFKGAVIWLGLAFIVMVFLVQQFSGYS